ncbi:E3 ubiquitin-protein ligase TRIM45-like [Sycon ciliatum]|uniref:E3 ubiquitin-protein ligase TRIM45-like n=1 Tax=Sycon ciliatum TaxID=27933 RepID=UPI0031F6E683
MSVLQHSDSDSTYSAVTDLCVFCNKKLVRGRMLSCLHNICLTCVREEIGGSNHITCPRCGTLTKAPKSGFSQLLALPNAYVIPAGRDSSTCTSSVETAMCDECVDAEEAKKVCVDCGLMYCDLHAHSHQKSRGTHSHTLRDIGDQLAIAATESAAQPAARADTGSAVLQCSACPLHGSRQLDMYCEECAELSCKKCVQRCAHSEHKERVVLASEAAGKLRQKVKQMRQFACVRSDSGREEASSQQRVPDERVRLQSSLAAVKDSIKTLNRRVELVSEDVNQVFDAAIEAAKKRQQSLLEDLDKDHWAKQKVLEEQQQQLERALELGEQMDMLLERRVSDLDFLRMSAWMEDWHKDIASCLERNSEPAVSGHVVFKKSNAAELQVLASKVGIIQDIAVDVSKSSVSCLPRINSPTDLDVMITATTVDGDSISAGIANDIGLCVSLRADEGEAAKCEIVQGASPGKLKASLKSPAPGMYHVSVTMGHRHLQGSPMTVEVTERAPAFDPGQRGPYMELSNENRTVRLSQHSNHQCICSADTATQGMLFFKVRLDTLYIVEAYTATYVAVSCNDPPSLSVGDNTRAYGWRVNGEGAGFGGGKSPAVESGDVVTVLLNCDESTVTFTLERTGHRQVFDNIQAGKYYLYIYMYDGHSNRYPQMTLC